MPARKTGMAHRLVAVRFAYPRLPGGIVTELITDAWARKAPRRFIRTHQATPQTQDG